MASQKDQLPRAGWSHLLPALAVFVGVIACSSGATSDPGAAPVTVTLDFTAEPGGKFPDTAYAVPIEPRWGADSLEIGTWIATDSYEHLERLECEGVATELPSESADNPSQFLTIELGQVDSVKVDCEATFDGQKIAYGVEWPDVFRTEGGEIDAARSDLSQCHVGSSDGPVPNPEDLVSGSRLIVCDVAASIARSSPGDYWLSPQPLIIYP